MRLIKGAYQYTSRSSQGGILNQFNLNYPNEIQKIFENASNALQESNDDIMKISDILESLEANLQIRMVSPFYSSIQDSLREHTDWVKATLKEFNLQVKVYKVMSSSLSQSSPRNAWESRGVT